MLSFELRNSKKLMHSNKHANDHPRVFIFLGFGQLLVSCWFGARWFGIQTGYNQVTNPSHNGDSRTLKPPIWEVHFMPVSTCPRAVKTVCFPSGKKKVREINGWNLSMRFGVYAFDDFWKDQVEAERKSMEKWHWTPCAGSPIPQTWQHATCTDT